VHETERSADDPSGESGGKSACDRELVLDLELALARKVRVDEGVVRARRLDEAGEHGRLGPREVRRRRPEVRARRLDDTVGSLTIVGGVEVQGEELGRRVGDLELEGETDLLELGADAGRWTGVDELRELLRDATPSTPDDCTIDGNGRRIDTPEKARAWVAEQLAARASEQTVAQGR
jgi:hypothetical protein